MVRLYTIIKILAVRRDRNFCISMQGGEAACIERDDFENCGGLGLPQSLMGETFRGKKSVPGTL